MTSKQSIKKIIGLTLIALGLGLLLSSIALNLKQYYSKKETVKEFKEYTGISIHQYLLTRRVLMGQEMIQQGMKPNEAAVKCGFQEYTSFYRAFKARTGISPEQYRQRNGK